jgi:hypothetical protein
VKQQLDVMAQQTEQLLELLARQNAAAGAQGPGQAAP